MRLTGTVIFLTLFSSPLFLLAGSEAALEENDLNILSPRIDIITKPEPNETIDSEDKSIIIDLGIIPGFNSRYRLIIKERLGEDELQLESEEN